MSIENNFENFNFSAEPEQEKTQEEKEKEEYLENYLEAVGLDWEDLEGKQVLDIGAGLGEFGEKAKEKDVNVTSLEAKPELWEEEGEPSKETPYVQGDASRLPFQDNSFDVVISRAAPPVISQSKEEVKEVVQEAERVLSEGGEFHFGPAGLDAEIFSEEELNAEAGGNFQELNTEQRVEKIRKKALEFLQTLNPNIEYKEKEDPETGERSGFYVLKKEPQEEQKEGESTETEKDKEIAEELQSKLKEIENFELSGDIVDDFNSFLEVTGRDGIYKKVDQGEKPEFILAGLTQIKKAWEGIMRDPQSVDTENEAKKLFFLDIPQKEIEAANRFINFYLNKYSKNEKDLMDEEFEQFKQEKFSNKKDEGDLDTKSEENSPEDPEVSLDEIEKDEELSEEDKKECEEWEKQVGELKNMPISGDIVKDYNKIVELVGDEKMFKKVNSTEKPNTVLMNLVKMQTTLENAYTFHGSRSAEQKEAMKKFYLKNLDQMIENIKKFVDYYRTKQSL